MRKHTLSLLALSIAGALFTSPALRAKEHSPLANAASPQQLLLQQVRQAEASNRYDLVTQALYRLDKIDPDNPEVLAAKIRLALHQGESQKARDLMASLRRSAPNADATREADAAMLLATPEGREKWQQARLLATAGRLEAARAQYDALFNGNFPGVDVALEYWQLVARLPGGQREAQPALQALDKTYPGNSGVRLALARIALSENKPDEAIGQLKRAAEVPAGRDEAAETWLTTIKAMPVSAQSVAALQQYLQTFTRGDARARGDAELQRQQAQLTDPVWQQRQRGLTLIDRGAGAAAIPALRAALQANPHDGELLGAMGQALARTDQRAAAQDYYQRAIAADAQSWRIDKWRSLQASNQYWLAIGQGDAALKRGDTAAAQQRYQQARALDGRDPWAAIGLGDVALARHDSARAETFYRQALRLEADNATAVRRLAALYQQQSPERAMAFINELPAAQQRTLSTTVKSLRSDGLRAQAEALARQGSWAQAAARYRQAQQDNPDDVWLNYRLAGALRQAGQPAEADRVMAAMATRRGQDAEFIYAWGLYLSGSDRDAQALQQLQRLPKAQWTPNMQELATRLEANALLDRANALRDAGDEAGAGALLRQSPPTPRIQLTLADWALQRGDAERALAGYRRVKAGAPQNTDAQLGEVEALIALQRQAEARTALAALPPSVAAESLNSGRRVANAWQSLGDTEQAQTRFASLKARAQPPAEAQSRALVWRDAARLEPPQLARDDYAQAMVASGIAPTLPTDDDGYTRLSRNQPGDDWLKRSIRSDAAALYRRQETTVTLEQDYSRNKGTGGYSDFTGWTTMLQVDTPLADGKSFFRADRVQLDAGRFSPDADGNYSANFGTCDIVDCRSGYHQKTDGVSVATGWANDRWSADIGTTPMGFDVVDWVGGVTWNSDVHNVGVSLTASRRPISSSMLSYAGATDPNTGQKWGGVRATGGGLGLSYDRGGDHGVWADLSAHQLTGKNVADNRRERLMAGYYYKWINEDNRRATIGLNTMLWHYQKDLSDYYFSQGGYYSPQRYFSLAVPVNYRQRTDNWSFEVGGSVSWSRSRTDASPDYPRTDWVPGNVIEQLNNAGVDNPFASRDALITAISQRGSRASSSSGVGYTAHALIERRVSSHWTVGLGIDIQQAKDYTPSHGLLYVRYSMAGWQGDLDLPPQPLIPYADFK
ncbi:cellulose synthase complex outer membrane protein BcsC [Pantoea sp. 1.19]|uniref:cellulose synthase complex outer membrane protein BcsC n=1 Tax=Pantoea sp. 1.19 TaxID=1925589 RepID=UPI000948C285|nr:cellulose synthase complex outer membrane protein BcsC [Pantoea sp. 1.19]